MPSIEPPAEQAPSDVANADARRPAHWGLGATLVMGVFVMVIFAVLQMVAAGVWVRVAASGLSRNEAAAFAASAANDGTLIALTTLVCTVACTGLVIGLVKLKQGSDVREYLALRIVPAWTMMRWAVLVAVVLVLSDLLWISLGRSIVPEFMKVAYATAKPVWLFVLAIVVAAPVFEEIFVRGFLLKGFESSILRPAGAVVATSALWAIAHVQYGLPELGHIFVLGLIFGAARIATGSLLVPLSLHALTNLGATIEAALLG